MRISEILGLRWTDFDFKRSIVLIQRSAVGKRLNRLKTEYSQDEVPLEKSLIVVLKKWQELCAKTEQQWVFPSPATGRPYHADSIRADYLVPVGVKLGRYWYIQEGETPILKEGRRRPSVIFPPRDQKEPWKTDEKLLKPSTEYPSGYELALVNLIRERLVAWQGQGYPGVTRTTLKLIEWWMRDGREKRLFFAQLESALAIIFLTEARPDFLQGISIPRDEPSDDRKADGYAGFQRYACKMATGSGKTTVMGMLSAWSILNKVNNRGDGRFSDVALVVCPNVTIRQRLAELNPENGEASIYRTRDLVPAHLMPLLTQGRVLVTNWHVFEPQSMQAGGVGGKVIKAAAYYIDKHHAVHSFVKNAGLGFAIPYLHNGQMHDYMPDFIVQLKSDSPRYVIVETKGYDPLEDVKRGAAERWVSAVNAEGSYGRWAYRIAKEDHGCKWYHHRCSS